MKLSEADIAWAAGILEGEGCFSIFTRKTAKDHKCLHIQCTMTDEDVIHSLRNTLGVGTIYNVQPSGLRKDGTPMKPCWKWQVANHKDIKSVIQNILPWLGKRRYEKARELLEYIDGR